MYLINTETCRLESTECMDLMHELEYAILSHRWTHDEVLYGDMTGDELEIQTKLRNKGGFAKIRGACTQARKDGFKYLWVDTCCIDKNSSAELSEAINSMYRYYKEAKVCYAYLVGLPSNTDPYVDPSFANHEWFQRGWTLQELIAPKEVIFYTDSYDNNELRSSWTELGRKSEMCVRLSEITTIDTEVLSHTRAIQMTSVAKRMSWAARRETSRVEDRAYCLMGLFGVNMPMIYGEGPKAFIRLQEEIMRESSDESLFAWREGNDDNFSLNRQERVSQSSSSMSLSLPRSSNEHSAQVSRRSSQQMRDTGILASSPDAFRDSGHFYNYYDWEPRKPFFSTNRGLQITLYLQKVRGDLYKAALNCPQLPEGQQASWGEGGFTGIYLRRVTDFAKFRIATVYDQYVRVGSDRLLAINQVEGRGDLTTIYVQKTTVPPTSAASSLPIYPEHIVQLYRGPPCPPHRGTSAQIQKGYRLYGTMGVKPSAQLPLRHQEWIPKMLQRAFQVPREPGRLAAVVVFKRACDDTSFTVLLGTCPSDAGGVAAHVLDGCDESWTFGRWATMFAPKQDPSDTVATVELPNETIHVSIDSRPEHGKKYFVVDVRIDENPTPAEAMMGLINDTPLRPLFNSTPQALGDASYRKESAESTKGGGLWRKVQNLRLNFDRTSRS